MIGRILAGTSKLDESGLTLLVCVGATTLLYAASGSAYYGDAGLWARLLKGRL